MTELFDRDLRVAFQERASGPATPDLLERIEAAVGATRQERPLVVLPFVDRFGASAGRLAFAAVLGATVLAVGGTLLLGGGEPDPTTGPNPTPSPSPTIPSLAPEVEIPVGGLARIVGEQVPLRPRAGSIAEIVLLPGGTTVYVAAGPVEVNGASWYQVQSLDDDELPGSTLGWVVPAEGEPAVLEPLPLECPSGTITPEVLADLGSSALASGLLRLACFGDGQLVTTGQLACDELAEPREVAGWYLVEDARFCRYVSETGEPLLELFGVPYDELPPTWREEPVRITIHFDDPVAADCVPTADSDLGEDAAVLHCRTLAVVERLTAIE